MDKKEVIAFFDKNAPYWDDDASFKERVINYILDAGDIREDLSVLDVGCGTGVLFDFYAGRGITDLTGADISPEMVRIAKLKHPQVNVICADVETESFGRSFDRIMIHNAFPHFPYPERLLKRMSELLNDGGILTVAHSYSRDVINHRHSGQVVSKVSMGLPTELELSEMFETWFKVICAVSDDEKYIVAGIKR